MLLPMIAALIISCVLHPPPQYLGTVFVCCLFNALLHPGDVLVLVCVGVVEDCGTGADIIGKVRHVGAVMTYHQQSPHETAEYPVPCAAMDPEMFPEGLIFS
jgi:hypothetical protein